MCDICLLLPPRAALCDSTAFPLLYFHFILMTLQQQCPFPVVHINGSYTRWAVKALWVLGPYWY